MASTRYTFKHSPANMICFSTRGNSKFKATVSFLVPRILSLTSSSSSSIWTSCGPFSASLSRDVVNVGCQQLRAFDNDRTVGNQEPVCIYLHYSLSLSSSVSWSWMCLLSCLERRTNLSLSACLFTIVPRALTRWKRRGREGSWNRGSQAADGLHGDFQSCFIQPYLGIFC